MTAPHRRDPSGKYTYLMNYNGAAVTYLPTGEMLAWVDPHSAATTESGVKFLVEELNRLLELNERLRQQCGSRDDWMKDWEEDKVSGDRACFWVVYCIQDGKAYGYCAKHEIAADQAVRLAKDNPGKAFYIMVVVSGVIVEPAKLKEIFIQKEDRP